MVIAYASTVLSKSERNYPAYKLGFLALKWAITDQFNEYLFGGNFDVYTDSNPLTYILTSTKLDAVGQCWVAALANYNFQLYYKTGKSNIKLIHCLEFRSGYQDLDLLTVKATIGGCITENPLIKTYAGKVVIPLQGNTPNKVEIDKDSLMMNQEWKE